MRDVARATWIANFDMEDLIAVLLRWGMVLSFGLVLMGLVLRVVWTHEVGLDTSLHGTNVLGLLLNSVQRAGLHKTCSSLLIRFGVILLLLTPFARVAVSFYYFACVERSWRHALPTFLTLLTLGYILFLG